MSITRTGVVEDLFQSAANGNLSQIRQLLRAYNYNPEFYLADYCKNKDINKDSGAHSAIVIAADKNKFAVVKYFFKLMQGAIKKHKELVQTRFMYTLTAAAKNNHSELLQYFEENALHHGHDFFKKDFSQMHTLSLHLLTNRPSSEFLNLIYEDKQRQELQKRSKKIIENYNNYKAILNHWLHVYNKSGKIKNLNIDIAIMDYADEREDIFVTPLVNAG